MKKCPQCECKCDTGNECEVCGYVFDDQEFNTVAHDSSTLPRYLIAAVLLVAVLLFFGLKTFFFSPEPYDQQTAGPVITEDGNLVITLDSLQMIAERSGSISGEYEVFGASPITKNTPGFLSVLSRSDADMLKAKYGNYRKCANPGSKVALSKLLDIAVLANDPDVKKELQNISKAFSKKMATKDSSPLWIRLEGDKLNVKEVYFESNGKKNKIEYKTMLDDYYIHALKIVSGDS